MGPEQDFEALVLEWEERVVLWDRLVGETLATSAAGSTLEEEDRDGAGARGGTPIGGGPRIDATELLDRGSRRCEAQVDTSTQTELGVWVALGGRVHSVRGVVKQDHQWQLEAEQARQEARSLRRLVLGLWDRPASDGFARWRSRAREARWRVEERVRVVGLVKLARGKWQSSLVIRLWRQAVVVGKRGWNVRDGFGRWRSVAREARWRVEERVQAAG